eukprot:9832059-Alexandrium_andersonii.AAC.1
MSASLVGSEMCIRDRDRADRDLAEPSLLVGAGERVQWEDDPRCKTSSSSCLLYTSDAADDM